MKLTLALTNNNWAKILGIPCTVFMSIDFNFSVCNCFHNHFMVLVI